MTSLRNRPNRREILVAGAAGAAAWALEPGAAHGKDALFPKFEKAQIAITLDLEMARNFPQWEDRHWDYEKGNLNQAAKDYTVAACRRVKERGGRIHNFVVGQVFEQENVDWLKSIADEGHPLGNHTYDHVYLLAASREQLQFRFQRSPWLLGERSVADAIRENIALTNAALAHRLGVKVNGFRTPGGFATGLHGREDLQQMLMALGFDWLSCRYPAHSGIVDLQNVDTRPSQEAFDSIVAAQADAQPHLYPTGLLEIPMSPISDIGAFRNGRWQMKYFHHAIQIALDWVIENRACFDFLAHPSCLGVVDPEFTSIDLICDIVEKSRGAAEIVTLDTIAERARGQLAATGP